MAVLAAVLALVWPHYAVPNPARRQPKSHPQAKIDRMLREAVTNGFSGAVLVARGESIVLNKAYGSLRGIPIRTNSRFWIASTAKQFTSAAILKCQQQGRLSLDDSVARFYPGSPADKRTITITQLLAHLSGLDQSYVSEGVSDRQTAVRRMLDEPLIDTPGARFHYSNSNYQLAVAIVEAVSGRSYQDFVLKELWRPAGLTGTGFSGDAGARWVAQARQETPARLMKSSWGGEGVYSTTGDLLKWYRALRAAKVLTPANTTQLFSAVAPISEGKTALGWFIGRTESGTTRIFTRGNEGFGANSLIYVYPDSDTVIIVLTHAGNANDQSSWSRFVHAKTERLLSL